MPTDGDALVTALADRMALLDLVHAYAQAVDRFDADAAAELFTEDGELVAYARSDDAEPISTRQGRAAVADGVGNVRRYRATSHAIASHQVTVDGDRASGETRCVSHHLFGEPPIERVLVWYFRYLDIYARTDGGWRFARRELRVDFVEERPLHIP